MISEIFKNIIKIFKRKKNNFDIISFDMESNPSFKDSRMVKKLD
jgi:hypothetical protein